MRQGSWERRIWEDLSGAYTSERNAIRVVHDVESGFGEFLTVERTPIIELNSSYGVSAIRDITNVENGSTITGGAGEIILSTGTDANGLAELDSGEVGRYIPGFDTEIGIGIRIPTDPVGTQVVKWGGHGQDGDNGLYWGKDATGFFVEIFRDGSSFKKVYQSNFNLDTVDGNGKSGFDISNSDGHIYQIDFTWYGYGRIAWLVIGTVNGAQIPIPVHVESGFDRTSISSPNLKVHVEAGNGGTTTSDLKVYTGGRQYSVMGNYRPKYRLTGETNTSTTVGTTRTPLISFQRKDAFGDRSIKLEGVTLTVSGNSDINYEIVLDGGLDTSASFGTPTNHLAAETALNSDTSATTITDGHVLYKDHIQSGQTSKEGFSRAEIDVDIPNGSIVTLCAYTDSGSSDVKASFRMTEEW